MPCEWSDDRGFALNNALPAQSGAGRFDLKPDAAGRLDIAG
jgi:hypothetical protein